MILWFYDSFHLILRLLCFGFFSSRREHMKPVELSLHYSYSYITCMLYFNRYVTIIKSIDPQY